MLIHVHFDTSIDLFPNSTTHNDTAEWIIADTQEEDCWKIIASQSESPDPEYDLDYLNRIHIITVSIVSFMGACFILLLLGLILLSNETIAELFCKKKTPLVVNKGIDGYFPFVCESGDIMSSVSSAPAPLLTDIPEAIHRLSGPLLTPEIPIPSIQHNSHHPLIGGMRKLEIPLLNLEPCVSILIDPIIDDSLNLPIKRTNSQTSDELSGNSVNMDLDMPASPRKVYFIDEQL